MKNYEFEIAMMEAELTEGVEIPEPGFFNKPMTKRVRYNVTRKEEAKRRKNAARKKAALKKYEKYKKDEVHELGKDRHDVQYFEDTKITRITTERQLPIRVRRKGVDR